MEHKIILAFDPGTRDTGYAKIRRLGDEATLLDSGTLSRLRFRRPAERMKQQFQEGRELLRVQPYPHEVWVELYIPYQARKGMMYNIMLTGSFLTLPLNFQNMKGFGVEPKIWKDWIKRRAGKSTVEAAVASLFPTQKFRTTHEGDAAGIAYYGGFNEDNQD